MQNGLANDRLDHLDRCSSATRNLRDRHANEEIEKHVDVLRFRDT
jgi:hypothetical protein